MMEELRMASGATVSDIERRLLEEYVAGGKLVQVATIGPDGRPAVCQVWYLCEFSPDRLVFMSKPSRDHSCNIRRDPRVAGAIVNIELEGLGQPVRGVTFEGTARECEPGADLATVARFIDRWPRSRPALTGDPSSCLYEITVTKWVLFDEANFPDNPRRELLP